MTDVATNGERLPAKVDGGVPVNADEPKNPMSEQSSNVVNGPAPEAFPGSQDMTKFHPNGNGTGPPHPPYVATPQQRPPLQRIDSRSGIQFRPGFPVQHGPPPRAPPVRPNLPPGAQPAPHYRSPTPGSRPPGQPPFPQGPPPRGPFNPNLRPATPFPRPQQLPVRPNLVQQKSVPTFNQHPPELSERSLTLDAADAVFGEDHRHAQADNRHNVTPAQSRGHSLGSATPNDSMEERRQSVTSIGSLDGRRSAAGSIENIDKRSEADYPSRPESRASSRMGKIEENVPEHPRRIPDPARPQSRMEEIEHSSKPQETTQKEHHPLQKSRSSSKEVLAEQELPRRSPDIVQNVDKKEESPRTQSPVVKAASPISSQKQLDAKKEDTFRSISPRVETEHKSPEPRTNAEPKKNVKLPENKPELNQLDLKNLSHKKVRKDGDNDSGVDESTQGNDQSSNGDHNSPRKSANKTSRSSSMTPTKNRSLSRDSKSPSLKSPDSNATTPGSVERKKLPMNKIQVGSAPSPNLKVVKSKIGSLANTSYKPGGGNVKIESRKLDFKSAAPRIAAKNEKYTPKGGDKKIQQQKLQWNAKSKVGSLENTSHKPKGGDKKIESVKLDFKEKAKPKVGSKDNMKHVPGGGDIKIENKKIDLNVQSKVGSLDNMKHKPGGGEKKIFDDKDYLKQRSTISSERNSLSGSQNSLPSQPEAGAPLADENLNQER